MKKYLIFLAQLLVVASWATNVSAEGNCPALGVMIDGFGTCCAISGYCPQYGKYIGGTVYGGSSGNECYCLLDDEAATGKIFPLAPCHNDEECRNDAYCDSNGDCQKRKNCSNCTSSNWADLATPGYQSRTIATCDYSEGKCNTKTEYRCAKNYFGTANGTSGCSRCYEKFGTETAGPGNNPATACYIPAGHEIDDSSGTYSYTENCYYSI